MAVADVSTGDGSGSAANAPTDYEDFTVTGWTGYIGFAALMLILIGCFHCVAGFVGIFKDSVYAVPSKQLLVSVDYTTWGWVHLIFGLIAILVAIGMFAGSMWARILAVIIAIVSALGNLAFLDAKPVAATIVIAFDVLLIWALTVHGGEMKNR
jgi:hypothetical protein